MKFFLAVVLLCLCLLGVSWNWVRSWMYFHARPDPMLPPAGLQLQTQYVTTPDKQKIAYWYVPVKNPTAVVILVHGYSDPGGKSQMLGHADYLAKAGYSVAMMDLRSFGESPGQKISFGVTEWQDVSAIYQAVKNQPENQKLKVGYLGVSMGAVTAIISAAESQQGDFLIASVPYTSFDSWAEFQIKKAGYTPEIFMPFVKLAAGFELGAQRDRFTAIHQVSKVDMPILVISARQDGEVNSHDAVELYELAQEPKELWELDSWHEVYESYPDRFESRVLLFLEKYARPTSSVQ